MQTGSVGRHGDGWRGRWREGGKHRSTDIVRTKGEARRLLNAELLRLEMGDRYRAPITLAELADRFMAQYDRAPKTVKCARGRLVRPLAAFGDAQAADITTEALQRFVAALPAKRVGKAYKRDIVRTLRAVYSFGVDAGLVDRNPAVKVKAPRPVRGERILPLTIAEVDAVAEECGRWGPLVTFMADTGARPAEAVAVEWRHVDLDRATVELPGQKTELAWRTVHMTERGVSAIQAMPRGLKTRRVFNIAGRPISWVYFWREVWTPSPQNGGPRAPRAVQPQTHLRLALPPGRCSDPGARPPNGPHRRQPDIHGVRRMVARDGRRHRRSQTNMGRWGPCCDQTRRNAATRARVRLPPSALPPCVIGATPARLRSGQLACLHRALG